MYSKSIEILIEEVNEAYHKRKKLAEQVDIASASLAKYKSDMIACDSALRDAQSRLLATIQASEPFKRKRKFDSFVLCNHANESPYECPCDDCVCWDHSCVQRFKTVIGRTKE